MIVMFRAASLLDVNDIKISNNARIVFYYEYEKSK